MSTDTPAVTTPKSPLAALEERFGKILMCPRCHAEVSESPDGSALVCAGSCGTVAAVRDGVIDFVSVHRDDRGDLTGFAYQWKKVVGDDLAESVVYNSMAADVDEYVQRLKEYMAELLGMSEAEFKGLRVADLGCGHGQYLRALAGMGTTALGVDLSEVVYTCESQDRKKRPRLDTTYLRADLLAPAIKEKSLDVVICVGVANATPDAKRAVINAAKRVKPGGRLLLYVYEKNAVGYITLRDWFPYPTKLPRPALLWFCKLLAGPLSVYLSARSRELPSKRVYQAAFLGLFDGYEPTYAWTFTPDTLLGWIREAGLVDVKRAAKCFYVATGA